MSDSAVLPLPAAADPPAPEAWKSHAGPVAALAVLSLGDALVDGGHVFAAAAPCGLPARAALDLEAHS